VAERIRSGVSRLSFTGIGVDDSVRMTISVGVATFPVQAGSGASLIVAADQAMYVAKRNGKNAVVVAG
jgi:diguanylate cyclase (GGDEF)-like protein